MQSTVSDMDSRTEGLSKSYYISILYVKGQNLEIMLYQLSSILSEIDHVMI